MTAVDRHHACSPRLNVEDIILAGDAVAVRCTERGTFHHAFRGQAPTGKSYEPVAMEWFRAPNGKMQQRWDARDALAQACQTGFALHESSLCHATTHFETDANHGRR